MADYTPKPEHKFTFGLWTVGNIGRDPFGEPTRDPISPVDIVHMLAEVGAWGVNLHDTDLVPLCDHPDRFRVLVAGGAGKHSCVVPSWGMTRSVTLPVEP